jgi:hypothetical protein
VAGILAGILEVTGVDTGAAVMVSMAEGLVDTGAELVDTAAARAVGVGLHQTLGGALSEIMAEDGVMGADKTMEADRITELYKVMGVDKISELDKAGEWGGLGRQD